MTWLSRLLIIGCLFVPSISAAFCFNEAGQVFGINPDIIRGIARLESNFNPEAIHKNKNRSVDLGLMQINSAWISTIGLDPGRLISDPCYNVMTGAKILDMCIKKYGYTWEATGCYNAMSRPKRVEYSWRLYNEMKAQTSKNRGRDVRLEESALPYRPSAPGVQPSSFSFSVRDKAAIE